MDYQLIEKSKAFVSQCMKEHGNVNFTYHNMAHTTRVEDAAKLLADRAKLNEVDRESLVLAAIYHDVGYCFGADGHEKKSAEIAEIKLKEFGVDEPKIKRVQELIMATKMGYKSDDKLGMLLKDADMSGLADRKYIKIAEGLRREKNYLEPRNITEDEWLENNLQFFKSHDFATEEGKELFGRGKKRNLKKLRKKKARSEEELTIASSKSAQTQLKTALRNHIDLSAIADNKANIMLSVNAIVITVGIPLLIEQMVENPNLLIPTIIIGMGSVVSMVFATLSTRPQKMDGQTDMSLIPKKKTNLFFFGNFYKMGFDNYEEGMKVVVGDNEIMDNSITRDLFFLGKSLGVKFAYLRVCYNVFMASILLSVLSLVVIAALTKYG